MSQKEFDALFDRSMDKWVAIAAYLKWKNDNRKRRITL